MSALYKISDTIQFEFFRLPKALFANPKYKAMSSDAKLTYSLLYDRLSLSKQNGWINEKDEVFLIYTREEIAVALGITYKKAMAAFRELISNGLIFEKRCGRGMANKIYIVKPDVTPKQAREYEPPRTAESEVLDFGKTVDNPVDNVGLRNQDVPKQQIKNRDFGTSKTSIPAGQELPKRQANNYTDFTKTEKNQIDFSQSVVEVQRAKYSVQRSDGGQNGELREILARCHLELFDKETRIAFADAIERLFYTAEFKIGGAVLPQRYVRNRLRSLDYTRLTSAQYKLNQNLERPVRNVTGYIMSTIFNSLAEEYSICVVDPYLNRMRIGGG